MERQNLSSHSAFILSGLTALAAIITTASPIFFENNWLRDTFVDDRLVLLASVSSLITIILVSWFIVSIDAFLVFKRLDILSNIRFHGILLFPILMVIFYLFKVLSETESINNNIASILQLLTYLSISIVLSLTISISLSTSFNQYRNQNISEGKYDLITQTLIKSCQVNIDLEIYYIQNHLWKQDESIEFQVSIDVAYRWKYEFKLSVFNNSFDKVLFSRNLNEHEIKLFKSNPLLA